MNQSTNCQMPRTISRTGRLSAIVISALLTLTYPFAGAAQEADIYFFHSDHLGTPQKLTDETGTVVWEADYRPFGNASLPVSGVTNNIRFPGHYFDAETGLHYNYFRDYDPFIGRYTQSDPIGLYGGANVYSYVSANPISKIDPSGLFDGIAAIIPPIVPGDIDKSIEISEAQVQGVAAVGPLLALFPATIMCARIPECALWAQTLAKNCKNIRCKLELHGPHHPFGEPINKRLPHIQLTCYVKGLKGSHRIWRIPLPTSMSPKGKK